MRVSQVLRILAGRLRFPRIIGVYMHYEIYIPCIFGYIQYDLNGTGTRESGQ